jgi:hypothetical protein
MVSDDESKTSSETSPVAAQPVRPARRSRRGGRRHSRGRGPRGPVPPVQGEAQAVESPVTEVQSAPEIPRVQEAQPPPRLPSRLGSRLVPKSSPKLSAINQAIEQVNVIAEELRRALDHMEEVLETLELADRQKIEDEREIESLRRALRQLHEPRDAGRERRGAPLTNTRLLPGEKERPD